MLSRATAISDASIGAGTLFSATGAGSSSGFSSSPLVSSLFSLLWLALSRPLDLELSGIYPYLLSISLFVAALLSGLLLTVVPSDHLVGNGILDSDISLFLPHRFKRFLLHHVGNVDRT
jgi:hypothetical protein